MNAFRQVPTLLVGETPLTQSLAIMEYLEEAYPTPPLLPPASEVQVMLSTLCVRVCVCVCVCVRACVCVTCCTCMCACVRV